MYYAETRNTLFKIPLYVIVYATIPSMPFCTYALDFTRRMISSTLTCGIKNLGYHLNFSWSFAVGMWRPCTMRVVLVGASKEIAKVRGTFAPCCLWAWQIFHRRALSTYLVSQPSRIKTTFSLAILRCLRSSLLLLLPPLTVSLRVSQFSQKLSNFKPTFANVREEAYCYWSQINK